MRDEIKNIYIKCKSNFFWKFIVSIGLRGILLIIPIFYSYAVEKITNGDINTAFLLTLFLLISIILYYLSEMLNDYVYEKLYHKLYICFTRLGLNFTKKNSIYSLSRISLSEYNSIMSSDIDTVSDCYGGIPMFIARIIELIIVYWYFFNTNFLVGLLACLVTVLVMITLYFGNKKVNNINTLDKSTNDQRIGVIQEYFLSMKEIKGFRMFPAIHNRIEKSYENYMDYHTSYGLWKVIVKYGALGIVDTSKILFLFYGFYLAYLGNMSLAVVILIYSYFDKLTSNLTGILDFNNKWQNAKVANKRIFKLKEYSHEDTILENEKTVFKGLIEFNNVIYGNRNDPILNDFNAHFKSNSITVVTGRTGAGKTGIVDLLLKLNRQHEGDISIDKINIDDFRDDIYFSSVAAVRKNPSFFHMSIRDNLQIIEPDFEKIVDVCKELSVHDDIMRLKDGYDTIITDGASNVSNDIKYLLSIVRVVLRNPKILIFDETLNAFPKEVDLELMEYFKKTKGSHTVIIISKEKHVIEEADQVVYMDKGKAIVQGKHDTLMLKNEEYRNYFNEL